MSIFNEVQLQKPKSNTFDLSHDRKMSMSMGELTPILCMEALPGDIFNISTSQMVRFAPLVAPVMHQVNVYTHFFFVPNRIIWPNFENFIFGGEDGLDTSVAPYLLLEIDDIPPGSLADYMGLPSKDPDVVNTQEIKVSALPFAAMGKIINDYYRDQNLQSKQYEECTDGQQTGSFITTFVTARPKPRSWQHGYFQSALPFTQKGPEATIPLGTEAPLLWNTDEDGYGTLTRNPATGVPFPTVTNLANTDTPTSMVVANTGGAKVSFDITRTHTVDLSSATAASIIDLRRAFKLQEWLEINARAGTRYNEGILAHFGVKTSDARLQRPEFLGGSKTAVSFSEVLQTSGTESEPTPQGNMAGHGISVGYNKQVRYFCEEYGYIIGIMSVMPKPAYFQGIPKHFFKFDKFDYFWTQFAHIGEQAIIGQELFVDPTDANKLTATFGYTPRYAEYKYIPDSVHGQFRTTLDFWHLAQKYATQPLLNSQFIACNPSKRIFAVEDEQSEDLYCHVFNSIKATRRMPYFGNPKM